MIKLMEKHGFRVVFNKDKKGSLQMGKASRNKRENLEVRRAEAAKKQQELQKQKSQKLVKKVLTIVAVVLVVALLAVPIVYNNMLSNGFVQRNTISLTSENYKVDNTMASYYFYNQYQNFMSYYGSYASSLGLDTTKSLKAQSCAFLTDGGTWYDYFMDAAIQQMKTTLMFCEEAIDRGLTLDDEDYAVIKDSLKGLKAQAKANGVSTGYYISSMFGAGVKEKDLRRVMEMDLLYSKCQSEIVGAYAFAEADFDKYVADNPTALLHYDYATISLSTSDGMLEGDITTEILADFKAQFEAVTSKDEFDAVALDYLTNYAYKDYEDKTEEDIAAEVEGMTTENALYSDNDFGKWMLEEGRAVNDVYVNGAEDGSAFDAYILLSKPALADYKAANVRHILLTTATYGSDDAAKAKAEELLAQWESGEKTAASFGELANEHSEDGAENGLYENVILGEMVEAFEGWLFEDGRAVGDSGIVKSEYGYHIMYMDGFGMPAWHKEADNALKNAQYEADTAALAEKHAITVDEVALAMLDV